MNDSEIIMLLVKNDKINPHYKQIICKDMKISTYLENRYKDSNSIIETIYRIQKGLEEKPKCLNCGKPLQFISGLGYKKFCSVSCSKKYIKTCSIINITDDIIKQDYLLNGEINSNKLQLKYIKEHGYYDYLINRYTDSYSLTETIYRICNSIEIKPVCEICSKPVRLKSLKDGFDNVCSDICSRKNSITYVDDDFIKNLSLKGQAFRKDWRGYNKVYEYLHNKFGDQFRTYDEAVYMVRQGITEIPKCPVCGKFVQYKKNRNKGVIHYTKYCSSKCYSLDIRQKTVNNIKQETGLNIRIDDNRYEFVNACNIHKVFYMDIDMFHNRCKLDRLTHNNVLCPICNPERNRETNIEQKIKQLLDDKKLNYIQHNRDIIDGKELDFFLPEYNIAIECNGMYWHSIFKKDKAYHKEKYELCKEKGITLLQFWEYDIINSINVISNIIDMHTKHICYLMNSNIEVKEIDNEIYSQFKQDNWFIRNERHDIKLGLYWENKLISVLGATKKTSNIEIHNLVMLHEIVSNTLNYFVDFIRHNYEYNKILLFNSNDLHLKIVKDKNITFTYKPYSFYYNQTKNIILNKKHRKYLYKNDTMFLCYTSGMTVYTLAD